MTRARRKKRGQPEPVTVLVARLVAATRLAAGADGTIAVQCAGDSETLGKFSARAAAHAKQLRAGIPIGSFGAGGGAVEQGIRQLSERLAQRGLLEYALVRPRGGGDQVVIEPQTADYRPRIDPLRQRDTLVLSRFAYMHRRANDLILESPRALAVFRICDPAIAAALATVSAPRTVAQILHGAGRCGLELLGLLVDCQMLFSIEPKRSGLRADEGDASLVLWDFQDLLFHSRSTKGRHANPMGGVFPYAGSIKPLPAVRPP